MTDKSHPQKSEERVEELELNKETVRDLTEQEGEGVKGGRARADSDCDTCAERGC